MDRYELLRQMLYHSSMCETRSVNYSRTTMPLYYPSASSFKLIYRHQTKYCWSLLTSFSCQVLVKCSESEIPTHKTKILSLKIDGIVITNILRDPTLVKNIDFYALHSHQWLELFFSMGRFYALGYILYILYECLFWALSSGLLQKVAVPESWTRNYSARYFRIYTRIRL